MKHRLSRIITLFVFFLCFTPPSSAKAQQIKGIRTPTKADIKAASTLFKRGPVIVAETNSSGRFKQVTLYGKIPAPQKTVFDVLSQPDNLKLMQPPMHDIQIKARKNNAVTFAWEYGDLLTAIRGTWSVALAPTHAAIVRSMSGFGPGFILYRLYPNGPNETTITISMNMDVTKASNPLLRWFTKNSSGFHESWNLGYALICFRGLRKVAIQRSGGTPPPNSGDSGIGPLRPLSAAQAKALGPLLKQGTVAVIESDKQGRISQASLAEYINAPSDNVLKIIKNTKRWSKFINSLDVSDVNETGDGRNFKMGFVFTALNVETDMNMRDLPNGADLQSPSGDLRRSLISFRTVPSQSGTLLMTTGRFRLLQAGRLMRRMVKGDPDFGHALNASSLTVLSQAFKHRSEGN